MKVVSSLGVLEQDLEGSKYIQNLSNRDKRAMFPRGMSPITGCLESCHEITITPLIEKRVRMVFDVCKITEAFDVNIVMLHDMRLQRGASWSVGQHSVILFDLDKLEHEVTHLVTRRQPLRVIPDFFEIPLEMMRRLLTRHRGLDNPDASIYEAPQYAYGNKLVPIYVLSRGRLTKKTVVLETNQILRRTVKDLDHPYELYAVWVSEYLRADEQKE